MLISEYLEEIYFQFKNEVATLSNLCELKEVNYLSDHIPDYTNRAVQLFYCLKYHFGYACEYELMYKNVLKELKDKDAISVLSIGCGNGIDLWALQKSLERTKTNVKINYYGVDKIEWCNKVKGRDNDNVNYVQCNVSELKDRLPELDNIDILIFPKSISELTNSDLTHIVNFLDLCTNEVYILASYRANDYNLSNDIKRMEYLCNGLGDYEFIIKEGNPNMNKSFSNKEKGIKGIFNDYNFPENILDQIKNIDNSCKLYDENRKECSSCLPMIKRSPILTLGNINYNYIKLQRNNYID